MATPSSVLPGESQGRGSLVGCRLWGHRELDTTEATQQQQQIILMYLFQISSRSIIGLWGWVVLCCRVLLCTFYEVQQHHWPLPSRCQQHFSPSCDNQVFPDIVRYSLEAELAPTLGNHCFSLIGKYNSQQSRYLVNDKKPFI